MRSVTFLRARSRPEGVRRRLLRAAALATAALAWFVWLAPNSLGGPVGVVWVSGTSMEPTMHTGDLAILYEQDRYAVGDVVAFEIPGGGTVIHRIIAVTDDGYRFQGDNRDFADPWLLDGDSIIGRQVALVPRAGTVITALGQPHAMAVSVAMLALLWWSGRCERVARRGVRSSANSEVTEFRIGRGRRNLRRSSMRDLVP